MRNATDVQVNEIVSISRQLYVKNKDRYTLMAKTLEDATNVLKKIMDIPEDFKVRIARFKSKTMNGRYWNHVKTAEVAPRFCLKSMIETLAHEMVHAEQYHQDRLRYEGGVQYWNGDVNYNKGSTYSSYRQQPWEVEAWDRQKELAQHVFRVLEI